MIKMILHLPISKKIIQSSLSKSLVLFITVGLNINWFNNAGEIWEWEMPFKGLENLVTHLPSNFTYRNIP